MTSDTRSALLDAAEEAFAEKGIAATSLREVTAAAGANLAAVHYHFGSKNALVREVFRRRIEPINQERLRRLDLAERDAGGPLPVEDIIQAFVAPALEVFPDQEACLSLMGRLYLDPHEEITALVLDEMEEVLQRFLLALEQSCPQLSRGEILRRGHFMVGTLVHTLTNWRILQVLDPSLDGVRSPVELLDDLVSFAAAGFRAPLPARP